MKQKEIIQINHVSQRPYKNTNQERLSEVFKTLGFVSNEWLTQRQAEALGRSIKAGEFPTPCMKMIAIYDKKTGQRQRLVPVYFDIYNLDQTQLINNNE